MNDSLAGITEALSIVATTWPCTPTGERLDLDALSGSELVAVNNAMGALRRHVDAVHARVASEIAGQSRPEHGSEGLAKKNGYRNPALLIAATTGTTVGDASRLVAVGEATAPRRTFSGDAAPARHPHVAAALSRGKIGTLAASAIITMLDRVALRSSPVAVDDAERILAEQAEGLAIDQLAKAIARAEAHLDPDGLEPKEHELRAQRSLHMFERDGVLNINVKLNPESGAPVKTAIQAIVTAEFRNERRDGRERPRTAAGDGTDADALHRTLPQRQADALVLLAAHALGCASNDLPIDGATAVVRMDLSDLESGTGVATVDGLDQPVSISTARRMAASGGVIPCVLGERSEILDWGRRKRLFTKAQKLALVERDGGCAMCGLPPGMTKVHHLRWWARDIGPTDLDNGVLLCETCHHRIHDNGWEIRIERVGADGPSVNDKVWFIPPVHVDPAQTPRLGGNARFSFTAA